jgi:hypothetical protein
MSSSANINIPLSFNQIIDLIKQLPKKEQDKIVSILQEQDDFEVPEWHKEIVRERIKNSKENELLDWDNIKDDFDGI